MAEKVKGIDKLLAKLRRLGADIPKLGAGVIYREAERIMTDAKRRTPVETGALRASGQIQPPTTTPTTVSVAIGFGNSSTPYAIYVHENLRARHPVGEAKFLENAATAARRGLDARLAADLRVEVERLAKT